MRAEVQPGSDGRQHLVLSGSIDENSDIEGMFAQVTGPASLNMQRVERVNSMGVHRWIPLVTRCAAQYPLAIEEISYALVQNANVVANLFGSATVRSCMAPYFCARCKENWTVSVSADEVAGAGHMAPVKHCGRCSSAMEFDELDGYFGFFKSRQRR